MTYVDNELGLLIYNKGATRNPNRPFLQLWLTNAGTCLTLERQSQFVKQHSAQSPTYDTRNTRESIRVTPHFNTNTYKWWKMRDLSPGLTIIPA